MTVNAFANLIPASGALTGYHPPVATQAPPYTQAAIDAMQHDGIPGNAQAAIAANAAWHPTAAPAAPPVVAHPPTTAPPAVVPPAAGGTVPATASNAWDTFRNSTNYQFNFDQGQDALNSQWAAHGMLQSGAASKAAIEYGANYASNQLGTYMNMLAGQQSAGIGALGAVTGAGTNYGSQVGASNTAAANAAANAALQAGQSSANNWGAVGAGIGQIGGALSQYGMNQAFPRPGYAAAPASAATSAYNVTSASGVPAGYWQQPVAGRSF